MASLVRVYYAFEVVKSDDVSYKIGIIGFCTLVEIAIGIIVSCLPVLPRLFQAFSPHISSAFSFQSKTGGITSRTSHTLILGTNGKKHPDGYVDLCGTRPAGQDASSPRHERGLPPPRRTVTNDSSPTLPAPSKTAPGQILQTTRIETEVVTEMDAANVSYANMNRQQLGW